MVIKVMKQGVMKKELKPAVDLEQAVGSLSVLKKRFNLYNMKIVAESESADHDAASAFPDEL